MIDEETKGAEIVPLAKDRPLPIQVPEPAPEASEGDERILASTALNQFSFSLMRQAKGLMDAGIGQSWFIALYLDHAAAMIARLEPRHLREAETQRAVEQLKSFIARKVAQRRRDARKLVRGSSRS